MKRKKFTIKIQAVEFIYEYMELLKYSIDTLESEFNCYIELNWWYDKNNMQISPILVDEIKKQFNIDNIHTSYINKSTLFSIIYSKEISSPLEQQHDKNDAKFYLFFNDRHTYMNSIFQCISFIKAKLNYDTVNKK
jgi:hypothetical protein